MLFLIPILHQTTTDRRLLRRLFGCFSFQFYIKPQHPIRMRQRRMSCFSFQFYIKPQRQIYWYIATSCCFSFQFYIKPQQTVSDTASRAVVSHSNSTSNHNWQTVVFEDSMLFLIPILHQTTTARRKEKRRRELFLIPILHQTTTSRMAVIHILHVTHMTPMHKTSCRTPGKLVGCNFVFQRAIYQKNSSC